MKFDEAMKHCIFRYVSGSHAYGTNRPESDLDYRGVFIAPLTKAFDLFQSSFVGSGSAGQRMKQAVEALDLKEYAAAREHLAVALDPCNGDLNLTEGTIHKSGEDDELQELRKFLKLASECNPNIIEFLHIDRLIVLESPVWKKIKEKRDLFLSKKARWTFSGYAAAQMHRIEVHRGYLLNPPKKKPARSDFDLPEETTVAKENQNALLSLPDEYISPGWKDTVRREKAYQQAIEGWRSYEKWKRERNPARQELEAKHGLDTKHAMHLVRLARMGKEILEEKAVKVFRPDREELVAIRNGAWTYEQLKEFTTNIDIEMDALYNKSDLRHAPDYQGISALYREICEESYGIKIKD